CELADRKPGMCVEHAHMAEPGVDLDLHHLHRAWHARADHEVVEGFQHPAEDHAHDARLPQRRGDAGQRLVVLWPLRGYREIGRGRDQFAPWRIRAWHWRPCRGT